MFVKKLLKINMKKYILLLILCFPKLAASTSSLKAPQGHATFKSCVGSMRPSYQGPIEFGINCADIALDRFKYQITSQIPYEETLSKVDSEILVDGYLRGLSDESNSPLKFSLQEIPDIVYWYGLDFDNLRFLLNPPIKKDSFDSRLILNKKKKEFYIGWTSKLQIFKRDEKRRWNLTEFIFPIPHKRLIAYYEPSDAIFATQKNKIYKIKRKNDIWKLVNSIKVYEEEDRQIHDMRFNDQLKKMMVTKGPQVVLITNTLREKATLSSVYSSIAIRVTHSKDYIFSLHYNPNARNLSIFLWKGQDDKNPTIKNLGNVVKIDDFWYDQRKDKLIVSRFQDRRKEVSIEELCDDAYKLILD